MRAYSCPICGSANCSIVGFHKSSRLASSPYDQSLSETAKERPGGPGERCEGRAHHARPGGVCARARVRPDDGGTAANGAAASRKRRDRVSGDSGRRGGLRDPGHDCGRAARNPGDASPRERPLQSSAGVPGILIAFASGIGAITTRNEGAEAALALPFGIGMGLTMDEAALLLDLEDVYWTRQGLLSVQVSLGVTAALAATILGLRMLSRGEEKGVQEGLIPAYVGEH